MGLTAPALTSATPAAPSTPDTTTFQTHPLCERTILFLLITNRLADLALGDLTALEPTGRARAWF